MHATVSQSICAETNNLPQRHDAPELHANSDSGQQPLWFVPTAYLVLQIHISIKAISQMQTWQRDNKLPSLPVSAFRRLHYPPHAHCRRSDCLSVVCADVWGEIALTQLRLRFSPQAHCMLVIVCLWCVQMCRALAHIHSMQVCHRDIKPQNLLVNTQTHQLKLCDFGSAKVLMKGEPNISYICSRSAFHPLCFQGSVSPFFCQPCFLLSLDTAQDGLQM